MSKIIVLCFIGFVGSLTISAQTTWGDSLTLSLSAEVDESLGSISLNWSSDADASSYKIYKKLETETSWDLIETLAADAINFTDSSVSENIWYTYKVEMNSSTTPARLGYVSSGINLQHDFSKGICLLVLEDKYILESDFADAYSVFKNDLHADGWIVNEIFVKDTDAVTNVKEKIFNAYSENPEQTHSLILLGHVPVPYSGNINPDGHPDHLGAWPTDLYYADMEGEWTDVTINSTASSNTKNHNVPGDGKFDQSYLPEEVTLQTGRIDFFDLPSFSKTEKELLIAYLNKNHLFRTAEMKIESNAIIDDNFTTYTEGFSQNGYRNFSVICGQENIDDSSDYFSELSYLSGGEKTYLWSYGCGGGWYQGASGIGDTYSFSIDSLSTVFTMLFGSYFGDWDNTDAFLRAPLAQGNTLTNCWAGRPNWHFYAMGIGADIGYCTKLSQNNAGLYFGSTLGGLNRIISMNLMGDPTLRMHSLKPIENLNIITPNSSSAILFEWDAATDSVSGYQIYRRRLDSVFYEKRNNEIITSNNFLDTSEESGIFEYAITAVKLTETPSGTFYVESPALFQIMNIYVPISNQIQEVKNINVYPNPADDEISIQLNGNAKKEIIITNEMGVIIQSFFTNETIITLNINAFAAGVYFLQCRDEISVATQKFVIK